MLIDPAQNDPLTPYLVNVKQSDLQAGKYNVILGEQLAGQLGVNRGDQIRVMVPSASQFTPMGRVPASVFNVIGTFAANSEVDGYQMLTNIDDASRLMRYPLGNITGWRLWLNQPLQVDTLSQQTLPPGPNGRTGASAKANCSRPCAWKKYDGPAAEPDRRRRGL
jgi:lipoprotein-releasing system permease protein